MESIRQSIFLSKSDDRTVYLFHLYDREKRTPAQPGRGIFVMMALVQNRRIRKLYHGYVVPIALKHHDLVLALSKQRRGHVQGLLRPCGVELVDTAILHG